MTRSLFERLWLPLATALLCSGPGVAMAAAPKCTGPLGGLHCMQTFSLVSISYIIMAVPYVLCALLILKPRFESDRMWYTALAVSPLISYVLTIAGFAVGDLLGVLRYAHDASPFFYIDWFVVIFVLLGQSTYVALITRKAASPQITPSASA